MEQQEKKEERWNLDSTITVDPGQAPLRLDKYLFNRIQYLSRSQIQKGIDHGRVLINDKRIKSNYKVRPGDQVTIFAPQKAYDPSTIEEEEMDLDIRYEDDDLMIIHKPAGLVVHPGVGNWSGTLVNGLAYYLKNLPVKSGNERDRMGLVHRIDKDTSGLLVIAKTDAAMKSLSNQFFEHTTERQYYALVWGEPEPDAGQITGFIGRSTKNRQRMEVYDNEDQGKWSVTNYKTIEPMYYVSLVECQLETGRTHQIRVHMSSIGHPLFGDERYGGNVIRKGTVFTKYKQFVENALKVIGRQSLHAYSLGFEHPTTGERMRFEAELPEDFQSVMNKWRDYLSFRKNNVKDE